MYNEIFFLFIILLILLQIKISTSSHLDCNQLNDCFNCSKCDTGDSICNCNWSSDRGKCESSSLLIKQNDWKNYFKNCEDSLSIKKQETYCGELIISKKKINLELPEINGYYGLTNLYCIYTYKSDKSSITFFNFDIKTNKNNIKIEYAVYFNDGTFTYLIINNSKSKTSYNDVKYIQFFIYLGESYSESPFSIEVTMKQYDKIVLAITIIVILFSCFCCVMVIYCFTKKFRRESNYYNDYNNDNYTFPIRRNLGNFNSPNEQRRNNKKKIELLLKDPKYLGSKICKKEYEKYGTNCTICLEEFKVDEDKISLTPCYHVFHYKCLSNYMRKSEKNIHCPNCNQDLLNSWSKMPENINPDTIQIYNRNHNNNIIINNSRRNTRTRSRRRENNEINNNENNNIDMRREDTNDVNTLEIGSIASRRNLHDRDDINNSTENNNNNQNQNNNNNNENFNNLEDENK